MSGRSQRHKVEEQGRASSGSLYEEGAINDQVLKAIGTIGAARPVLSSISPSTGVHGAADVTLTCTGTGFISGSSVIYINGAPKATTFGSATSLTATFPLSTYLNAGNVPVVVINGGVLASDPKQFAVT
ncbi:MAG TPA: IPT/TIG domain-containing protein [Mycobacterium sp.]|nr:IPT/TIG domain-containing protein [Mycobacterium sp.]